MRGEMILPARWYRTDAYAAIADAVEDWILIGKRKKFLLELYASEDERKHEFPMPSRECASEIATMLLSKPDGYPYWGSVCVSELLSDGERLIHCHEDMGEFTYMLLGEVS